mgnify:CR=1 FL=1
MTPTRPPTAANPFFAARSSRRRPPARQPVYARLPQAPVTASPVPHLTSLYHSHHAGEYGSRAWPVNCGGHLIKDVLLYFRPAIVCDPLCGGPHNGSSVAEFVMWRPTSHGSRWCSSVLSCAT